MKFRGEGPECKMDDAGFSTNCRRWAASRGDGMRLLFLGGTGNISTACVEGRSPPATT
jgi:hypothetical protein